ncbi:MAG TPA: ATP-binding protein, partial [Acidobacteriaceae bacterium]
MAPALLYEEDVIQLDGEDQESSVSPEVTVASALNTAVLPATPAAQPDSAGFIETWKQQRVALVARIAEAVIAEKEHTGTRDFDAYVESDACRLMLSHLRTIAFSGVERKLADHWGQVFTGRTPGLLMKEFRAGLRVEVVVPGLGRPSATDPLDVMMYRFVDGKSTAIHTTMPQFKARDSRFEVGKPVIFLYWRTAEPWSLIIPGKRQYQQFETFYYDDKNGKRWESGEIISKTYLENMTLPSILKDFALLDDAGGRLKAHGRALNEIERLQRQLATLDHKIAAWSKVALPEKQRNELLQRATLFEIGDRAAPHGLLLTGPPGTGKTLIARSLAESMQCHYQQLSIADLKKQQLGASGERVREVWTVARNHQPAVIFLDECEGILGRRGAAETDVIAADIVQAFLSEWDGVAPNAYVWVIGATNRRDMLDDAILSRFGWEMEIALPGAAERGSIFRQEMEAVFPGAVIPEEMAS